MKKIQFATVLFFFSYGAWSQGFNYQAIARDGAGTPIPNHAIGVQITILDAITAGNILYRETFTDTTNQFGLFTLDISTGAVQSGTFAGIDWVSDQRFMDVAIDPAGGTSYTDMGTTQLLNVPFAKRARSLTMFQSGTTNPAQMVIQHSPPFPNWGLQYADVGDDFRFLSNGYSVMDVGLGSRLVGVNTTSPNVSFEVAGPSRSSDTAANWVQMTGTRVQSSNTGNASLVPVAYGYIDGTSVSGTIQSGTGNFTVTKTSTGNYSISISGVSYYYNSFATTVTFSGSSGLAGTGFASTNSLGGALTISTYDTSGNAADKQFAFTVFQP